MCPIKYTFQLRLGDQVIKINRYIMHVAFSLYKVDYLGKELLSKQDEELLKLATSGKLSDSIVEKVEAIKDKLVTRKVHESKKPGYRDEWFEFQEEENVYEETLHRNETPRVLKAQPSLKASRVSENDDLKFKFEVDEDEVYSKATLGLQIFEEKKSSQKQLDPIPVEEGADEEDKELECQLTNRYQNKLKATMSDPLHHLPSLMIESDSKPQIRQARDAIASLKSKLQLNKLNIEPND